MSTHDCTAMTLRPEHAPRSTMLGGDPIATLPGPAVQGDLTRRLPARAAAERTLLALVRRYPRPVAISLGLLNLENLLRIAQPLCLGLAINAILQHAYSGLAIFASAHLALMAVRLGRQAHAVRAFSRVETQWASELALTERTGEVSGARPAANREHLDFLQRQMPAILRSLYSVVGAALLLGWYDKIFFVGCVVLAVLACLLTLVYGRQSLRLNHLLDGDLEREMGVVSRATANEVHGFYRRVADRRVQLSDWHALAGGLMQLFLLALMAAALLRVCTLPGMAAGDIYAVLHYVLMFVAGLDGVSRVGPKVSRLRDLATA